MSCDRCCSGDSIKYLLETDTEVFKFCCKECAFEFFENEMLTELDEEEFEEEDYYE